ncbi:MAG: SpoIID/LytB domain-containing protein [Endomicrobiales bacterium]|nr:SpoIID/LytB domain-containing protein [Endomicrobiales bacterium]
MKKNIKLRISLFVLITAAASFVNSQRLPETVIKIGILQKVKSFNMSCEGKYYLYELNSGKKENVKSLNVYLIKAQGNRIKFNGNVYSSPLRIVPNNEENRIRINGRRYRDSLLIRSNDGLLTVINELGIEGYIYGILPREVSPSWPQEVLKAQAIVSRTYALRNLGRHSKEGFDLCNKTHCQVYGGVESEDERTNKAVDATRSKVLVYENKLAQALFHACCAGHTENPRYVWNYSSEPPKYLRGRVCKFCSDSPHYTWTKKASAEFIRKRLVNAGYKVGVIKSIGRYQRTSSGRIKTLEIKHSKGELNINAAKFRLAVDPQIIKSTYINRIRKVGESFEFSGNGWGHGVGMCQWGAKGMAEKGYSYKRILDFYFPGVNVEKWEE